uniref:Uncharacterized protein n=1 Tax=Amphimedon queenslandica TaxID=400682 RepID=A0A1X7TZB8_AMPQE
MLRSVLNQTKDQSQLILAHFPIYNSLALAKKSSFIDKNAVISRALSQGRKR